MADKNLFLDIVGQSPQAKILDVLITGRRLDYSATGIINAASVGRATFYKVFPKLLKQGIIVTTRKIGNIQLYTINQKNIIVQGFIKLHQQIIMSVIDKYKKESKELELPEILTA